jgi:hypothetical protein
VIAAPIQKQAELSGRNRRFRSGTNLSGSNRSTAVKMIRVRRTRCEESGSLRSVAYHETQWARKRGERRIERATNRKGAGHLVISETTGVGIPKRLDTATDSELNGRNSQPEGDAACDTGH